MKLINFIPVLTDKHFINPLKILSDYPTNKTTQGSKVNPDPYVIKYNGEYYCYSSGKTGVPVLRSKDLVEWKYIGEALKEKGHKSFWAPAVIYHNGIFYMYYSSMPDNSDDDHYHFMKIATSMNPEGPFIYQRTLFNTFSIDAHVIKDEKGNFYLFYSTNEYLGIDDKRPGTVILIDRLIDLMTPEGNPKLVVKPTINEEIYEKNRFKDGRNWHTVEGAFYLNLRRKNYLFYSGSAYINKEYFVGYSVSFDGINWEKYPDDLTFSPLLKQNDRVEGTGHNSVIKAPNNVDYWIVYHGRNVSEGLDMSKEQRTLRIDPLLNKGNALWVPGPSYDFCDVPALPNFRDLFDYGEDVGLSTEWNTIEGKWIVKNKSLCQKRNDLIAKVINNIEFENYIFEVSLKWEKNHTGGLYGVYAAYNDSMNNLQILFDVGKKDLVIYQIINGIKSEETKIKLENDFNFSCYHVLKIEKTGSLFKIYLDDIHKCSGYFYFDKSKIGMITYFTSAYFVGLSITEHIELNPDTQKEFIKFIKNISENNNYKNWETAKGRLFCNDIDFNSPKELWFKKIYFNNYQIRLDFAAVDLGKNGYIGFYPAYKNDKNYIKLILNGSKIEIEKNINSSKQKNKYSLSENFNIKNLHTLLIKKIDGSMLVVLDNYNLFQEQSVITHEILGFTCIGSSYFEGIEITKL